METLKAILSRKSVRAYKPEQISEKTLEMILQAGCHAPVASGQYDAIQITVVQDPEILKQLAQISSDMVYDLLNVRKNMDFGAKTLIIVSSLPAKMPGIEYANAACILENMVLAAADQNVDSLLWGGAAAAAGQNAEIKKKLGIPENYKPLLCASFGYAAVQEGPKTHTISVNRV